MHWQLLYLHLYLQIEAYRDMITPVVDAFKYLTQVHFHLLVPKHVLCLLVCLSGETSAEISCFST